MRSHQVHVSARTTLQDGRIGEGEARLSASRFALHQRSLALPLILLPTAGL
jgi:hypothetical protein